MNRWEKTQANGYTREFFIEMGRRGGKARVAKMTPEERSAAARKAVQARWAKRKVKSLE